MKLRLFRAASAIALLALLFLPLTVLAHETITAGNYAIEYGWLNEPPVVGQPNAVVINISAAEAASSGGDEHAQKETLDVDVSQLQIGVVYGGETKTLALQPLGEDTPGQFIVPLTPTRAGEFTVRLTGKLNSQELGESDVSVEVQPEEVQTADVVQFPRVVETQTPTLGLAGWLGVIGAVTGVTGLGLGVFNLMRKK